MIVNMYNVVEMICFLITETHILTLTILMLLTKYG